MSVGGGEIHFSIRGRYNRDCANRRLLRSLERRWQFLPVVGATMLHRALCLLLLASSAGCAADVQPVFGGAEAIATIRDPATVQAYRLSSPSYQQQKLADYTMAAGPVEVSAAQASQLHGLLLDRATYEWDTAKGCIPNYGVRLHFQREKDEVDVLLCFECDMLAVYHNGQRVGSEDDFDNARPQLAAVVKELFPNDEAIQSLK